MYNVRLLFYKYTHNLASQIAKYIIVGSPQDLCMALIIFCKKPRELQSETSLPVLDQLFN